LELEGWGGGPGQAVSTVAATARYTADRITRWRGSASNSSWSAVLALGT
jgi:hypothetical protein